MIHFRKFVTLPQNIKIVAGFICYARLTHSTNIHNVYEHTKSKAQ